MDKDKIDFIITWVDGNDKKWLEEKNNFSETSINDDTNVARYRDWENLKYWFRGIENFTPWVNKIHFVTYGHLPMWLNKNHPKLNIVNHSDFIPNQFLPTFNSRAIEVNLHRIKGLSSKFVYFNDDMFVINHMGPSDFFECGLPKETSVMKPLIYSGVESSFRHALLNNMRIINNNFNKQEVIKRDFKKWVNLKYGFNLKNLILPFLYNDFIGFCIPHIPASYLKSTFTEVWGKEYEVLDRTSSHKFRDFTDVNPYLFSYWQMAKGEFIPRENMLGKYYIITDNNSALENSITTQKYKILCLNDVEVNINFEKAKESLLSSFDVILPEKSKFEI